MKRKSVVKKLYAAIFFLIIFFGCSIKDTVKSGSDEEALRERVTMYWNLKVKQEFDKSYEYEDPYYRKMTSLVTYIQGFNTSTLKWNDAKIKAVEMGDDTAKVEMDLDTTIKLPDMKKIQHHKNVGEEKWVKVEGKWYHIPEKWRRTRE